MNDETRMTNGLASQHGFFNRNLFWSKTQNAARVQKPVLPRHEALSYSFVIRISLLVIRSDFWFRHWYSQYGHRLPFPMLPRPHPRPHARLLRIFWGVVIFLAASAVLIAIVSRFYLIPAMLAAKGATLREKRLLVAWSRLLLAIILFILAAGIVLTFRIGRFFFPRHSRPPERKRRTWTRGPNRGGGCSWGMKKGCGRMRGEAARRSQEQAEEPLLNNPSLRKSRGPAEDQFGYELADEGAHLAAFLACRDVTFRGLPISRVSPFVRRRGRRVESR